MWPHVNLGGHRGGDPVRLALRYADVQPFLNLRGPDGVFKTDSRYYLDATFQLLNINLQGIKVTFIFQVFIGAFEFRVEDVLTTYNLLPVIKKM